MRKITWSCSAILILSVATAAAEAPGASKPGPCVSPSASIARQKTLQCRAAFQSRGLRGDDLINNIAVCVAEARLACLKKAVADHVTTPMRTQFIAACLGA